MPPMKPKSWISLPKNLPKDRGLDMKGKSRPVKAMDLLMSGLIIPEIGVTLTPYNIIMRVAMP